MDLRIHAPRIARELANGDSVSVAGVCLTVTSAGRRHFTVQVVEETLDRTTLGDLTKGSPVNLELPVRLSDRLGGHLVQGHVDGVANVGDIREEAMDRRIWVGASPQLLRYIVEKGSVTLDGVSLTVVETSETSFGVALIPHTVELTTLGDLRPGSRVNVEVDVLAKYVERLTAPALAGRAKE